MSTVYYLCRLDCHADNKLQFTAQRFADYENEIRVLQAQVRQEKRRNASMDSNNSNNQNSTQTSPQQQPAGISRFGSFMHSRKPTLLQQSAPASQPGARERELEAALVAEQTQRLAAEKKVQEVNGEIEELSATLFTQANDMVSTERKENARLQERIRVLEENDAKVSLRLQALEQRDADRRRRLERLEQAHKRIERVNAMLLPR